MVKSNPAKKIQTLCIIHQHARVLLGMKKRGFGAGRWNGFGGKLMEGESIENATIREVREEAGLILDKIEQIAIMNFEFINDPEIIEVHLFKAQKYDGQLAESEEMKPQWFDVENVPFNSMWPDDKFWFPLFLQGKKFKGKFLFGKDDIVLNYWLREVKNL